MAREQNIEQAETVEPSTEPTVEPTAVVAVDPMIALADATALLEAAGYIVRKRTVVARSLMVKADPLEVGTYFEATGLTRKEIADAVGVCVSVIATVQNPNGDRWSQTRYLAAKILIAAYVEAKNAQIAQVTAA